MSDLLRETVKAAYRSGICVVPPKQDGSKAPESELVIIDGKGKMKWEHWQTTRPDAAHMRMWYANEDPSKDRTGAGYVCGAVSKDLTLYEFDEEWVYQAYKDVAEQCGLGDLIRRIEEGYLEETPGGGVHWFYMCPDVKGNTELARRLRTAEEIAASGDTKKVQVLIETRGEGGYAVVAPSNGRVHPSGGQYRLIKGGPATITTITPEEQDALWEFARSFDQMPKEDAEPRSHDRRARNQEGAGDRPGDAFNRDAEWEDTGLFRAGWQYVFKRGGETYLRRPGKNIGVSATLNYKDAGFFYCFSTSTEFDAERGYSKFAVYTILNHNGDYAAAAAELARRGYGARAQQKSRPESASSTGARVEASDNGEPCTDLGNGERLIRYFGDRIRHSAELGWMYYDGRRWVRDEAPVREFAKLTVRLIYGEAQHCTNEVRREALGKHAWRSESAGALAAMLTLAATDKRITIRPDELDPDPWLFNCANGTVDLRTGACLPHNAAQLISKMSPVEYDISAGAPTWGRFVADVFAGSAGVAEFMRRAVGYSLTAATREQVWFLLYGSGSNGKSTFLDLLRTVFGDYAQHAVTETLLARRSEGIPNDVARLPSVRFLTAIESQEGRRLAEGFIKQLTGGDPITARFLHHEFFEFVPVLKLFFATNHRPRIQGTDHATWRRVLLVPFTNTWYKADEDGEPKRDPALANKIRADELPGVLAWAVRGCLEWQREGLRPPEAVKMATQEYRDAEDTLGGFLVECCECLAGLKYMTEVAIRASGLSVTAGELYLAFSKWCEEAGEQFKGSPPLTKTAFGLALGERGFVKARGAKNVAVWYGLRLAPITPGEER